MMTQKKEDFSKKDARLLLYAWTEKKKKEQPKKVASLFSKLFFWEKDAAHFDLCAEVGGPKPRWLIRVFLFDIFQVSVSCCDDIF